MRIFTDHHLNGEIDYGLYSALFVDMINLEVICPKLKMYKCDFFKYRRLRITCPVYMPVDALGSYGSLTGICMQLFVNGEQSFGINMMALVFEPSNPSLKYFSTQQNRSKYEFKFLDSL